jgi:hypothetical protein
MEERQWIIEGPEEGLLLLLRLTELFLELLDVQLLEQVLGLERGHASFVFHGGNDDDDVRLSCVVLAAHPKSRKRLRDRQRLN